MYYAMWIIDYAVVLLSGRISYGEILAVLHYVEFYHGCCDAYITVIVLVSKAAAGR